MKIGSPIAIFQARIFHQVIVGSHHSPHRVLRDIFVDPANHGFRRSGRVEGCPNQGKDLNILNPRELF